MWDAIRENSRRSWLLAGFMFVLMTTLGWFCAYWLIPGDERGCIIAAIVRCGVLLTLSNTHGDRLVLPVGRGLHPAAGDVRRRVKGIVKGEIARGISVGEVGEHQKGDGTGGHPAGAERRLVEGRHPHAREQ